MWLFKFHLITFISQKNKVLKFDFKTLFFIYLNSLIHSFILNLSDVSTKYRNPLDMKTLLRSAVKIGGSDLIVTAGAPPMLRLNGAVRNLELPPLSSEDVTRLLYSIISKPQRVILDEKKELDLALLWGHKET